MATSALAPMLGGDRWHALAALAAPPVSRTTLVLCAVAFAAGAVVASRVAAASAVARQRKERRGFDRTSAKFAARRRTAFPPPYANGWYKICDVAELDGGAPVSVSALGRDFVVFRGADGPAALDAHCPHLGAHLGVGGVVDAGTIRCPFHGWTFDQSGACVKIPYCTAETVPASAKTRSWTVRSWFGAVMLWFDAEDRPSAYELERPDAFVSPDWRRVTFGVPPPASSPAKPKKKRTTGR